jgi:hypothetical protein
MDHCADYNVGMKRAGSIVLLTLLTATMMAQVPAGLPFDASLHPNPVITWVRNRDFKPTTFAEAVKVVGVEMMSLSQDQGQRESVEIASPAQSRQRVRLADVEPEVTFYPVARQTYKLKSGKTFVLCSFRFPRVAVPAEVLNMAALSRPRRPSEARFGSVPVPDQLEIRGFPGLYFDDGKQRIVYWFELGAGNTVVTDASKDELFMVLEDLL